MVISLHKTRGNEYYESYDCPWQLTSNKKSQCNQLLTEHTVEETINPLIVLLVCGFPFSSNYQSKKIR